MPCCPFAYEISPARTSCTCTAHPVPLEAALPLSTKVWQGGCLVPGVLAWLMTVQRGICGMSEMTEHCFLLFFFYMNFPVILLRTVISAFPYSVQTGNCTKFEIVCWTMEEGAGEAYHYIAFRPLTLAVWAASWEVCGRERKPKPSFSSLAYEVNGLSCRTTQQAQARAGLQVHLITPVSSQLFHLGFMLYSLGGIY